MDIFITPAGLVRSLYDETLNLSALGRPIIRRASFVEPDQDGQWWADLSPVDGPKLGSFPQRSQALAAERAWLLANRLSGPDCKLQKPL